MPLDIVRLWFGSLGQMVDIITLPFQGWDIDEGRIDAIRSDVKIQRFPIDEMQFELRRCADVKKWNPDHGGFGETSAEESDDRWNGVILSSKGRDEQRHGIGRPGEDEATRSDDNT